LVNPAGQSTIFIYGNDQMLESISYPDGRISTLKYNEARLLSEITIGEEDPVQLFYDADHNMEKMAFPGGAVSHWVYDEWGRCTEETNPENQRKQYQYDDL